MDGYNHDNYSYDETSVIVDKNAIDNISLHRLSEYINITPSLFKQDVNLKILGVIPARYKSSRFEGKPLYL